MTFNQVHKIFKGEIRLVIEHLAFVVVFLPVQMEQGVRYLVRRFQENIRLDKGIVVPFQINYQLLSVILNFPDTAA